MFVASVALACLAVCLAWPVPIALSHARWPSRAPGTALVLWQAIALAGGLSMIGSLVTYGLIPFGHTLIDGVDALVAHTIAGTLPPDASIAHAFALCFAFLLALHLLLNLALTSIRTERQRRRHHSLVQLLSAPMPDAPNTRLLEHSAPVAYCLPGAIRSVTVLSGGLLEILDAEQLRGVIAHERAHLEQQHHLVLLAFKSWHSALPWFPIANRAENAVALLVEMLADDRARREVDDHTLATAIALVGTGASADAHGPLASSDTLTPASHEAEAHPAEAGMIGPRISRLLAEDSPDPLTLRIAVITASVALLAVPPVLLLLS
ncbi:M56 family metallopeptidase [Okibacterium endophyticum]